MHEMRAQRADQVYRHVWRHKAMRIVISDLPEGTTFWWVEEQMRKMLGDDIKLEQVAA